MSTSDTSGATPVTAPADTVAEPVRHAAVVGAGFMGGAIAAELALRVPQIDSVRVWDEGDGIAERAVARARDVAGLLSQASVVSAQEVEQRLARLRPAATMAEALDGVAYAAEAVPEELPLKQEVFERLDRLAAPQTVLASNTSGFDPAHLAHGLTHPERVLVAHYFGPAYLIPLVEVVPHRGTAEWAVARTLALLNQAGKHPVRLSRFVPGFVGNRLQQALFREALSLVREKVVTPEAVDEVVRFSFGPRLAALGPFTVADFAGLDVYASIIRHIWPTLSNESAAQVLPPEVASRIDANHLGTKTGAGFYDWPEERLRDRTTRRDTALVDALRRQDD
jgi:3-hydroxybutyryl-CoA dehydrogenase